jgi:hypothetical protein
MRFPGAIVREAHPALAPAGRGELHYFGDAGGAVNVFGAEGAQPKSTAAFAVFEFELDDFDVVQFHDCLR